MGWKSFRKVLRPAFQRRLDAYIEEQYVPEGTQEKKVKIVKGGLPPIVGTIRSVLPGHLTTEDIRELLEEKEDTFSERLLALIGGKHLKASDVYRKAGLTKALFSKIRHDVDYKPSKDTVLCLIFALALSEDEADDLMRRAGYSFPPPPRCGISSSSISSRKEYWISMRLMRYCSTAI